VQRTAPKHSSFTRFWLGETATILAYQILTVAIGWQIYDLTNQLGQFESGLTAAWWGTVPSVVVGGLGTIVIAVLWIRLFPSLLQRQTLQQHPS
jgi:hypothetical protein